MCNVTITGIIADEYLSKKASYCGALKKKSYFSSEENEPGTENNNDENNNDEKQIDIIEDYWRQGLMNQNVFYKVLDNIDNLFYRLIKYRYNGFDN